MAVNISLHCLSSLFSSKAAGRKMITQLYLPMCETGELAQAGMV